MSKEANTGNERTSEALGIKKLQEILLPDGSQRRRNALFDLDDTIKESLKVPWNDGTSRRYYPQTAEALQLVHESGAYLGVVTEQAFTDIDPFLSELAAFAGKDAAYAYFDGIVIGEGGTVVLERVTEGTPTPRAVFIDRFQEEKAKILAWFDTNLSQDEDPDGWRVLQDVDPDTGTYIQLPPPDEQGLVTLSIWEKGPHIGIDPTYIFRYEANSSKVREAMQEIGITKIDVFEAGNGTIRIVPKGRNKAHTIRLLSVVRAISLKDTVYFCDGPNDIVLAQLIKSRGGGVVAVGNAVSELKQIADYIAIGNAGLGVAEAVKKIFIK